MDLDHSYPIELSVHVGPIVTAGTRGEHGLGIFGSLVGLSSFPIAGAMGVPWAKGWGRRDAGASTLGS